MDDVKPKNVVVGYIRVSTQEQVQEGLSLETQEYNIRQYTKLKGLTLLEIIRDEGVSGGVILSKREGGKRLLDILKHQKVNGIVVYKLERIFRNTKDGLENINNWDKKRISLHLLDLGGNTIDTSSCMGRFFITLMVSICELEKNNIRDRTKIVLNHKKSKGERVSLHPQYGYSLSQDKKHLIPNQEEQTLIQKIKSLRQEGKSYNFILRKLTREGITNRKGNPFQLTQIVRILKVV